MIKVISDKRGDITEKNYFKHNVIFIAVIIITAIITAIVFKFII